MKQLESTSDLSTNLPSETIEPGANKRYGAMDQATVTASPTTTTYMTSEMPHKQNKYLIEYNQTTRKGKTEVNVRLSPVNVRYPRRNIEFDEIESIDCFIEYNTRIRKIRMVWGAKAESNGKTLHLNPNRSGALQFGYTIEFKGRYPELLDFRVE